jgi:DNA-binding transcriptional MerR regulator
LNELAFIERGKAIGFTLAEIHRGYEQYQILRKLCPEFIKQLQQKKEMFSKRIAQDSSAITEIEKMLG